MAQRNRSDYPLKECLGIPDYSKRRIANAVRKIVCCTKVEENILDDTYTEASPSCLRWCKEMVKRNKNNYPSKECPGIHDLRKSNVDVRPEQYHSNKNH